MTKSPDGIWTLLVLFNQGKMSSPAAKLLYCWVAKGFNVLVPKKRGKGFLKVPYGHHHIPELTDVANGAGCDVTGLDGSLHFECPGSVYYGGNDARKQFEKMIVPRLEAYYGIASQEINEAEFWGLNPFCQTT